ncbi:site-specific integrase [Riemerella anatipestifer]|uniref:site-specific integrase n=1 Tax=Riemerella anatipestifer TaxID=34085 RepID=UPI0021D57F46|nr:site-specific integrase [Riemerella anatipestifer]MCU7543333.1 site-specific integrase [Riemerella anatipestifer]MCW0510620.1 site-specific integrase [Riemerella anatipestifer]MCW0514145.1 site-specific integrase [Riemerella anatipestifer]MCW0518480.1 site-specific integrase [Riemerella anatipestifer]MDY3347597.1 site-specific integrase [Riemerella anatipestifer]
MTITIKIDTKQTKKQGHPIILYIYVSKTDKMTKYTGYYSTADNWDFEKEEPKRTHPLFVAIMDYLLEKRRIILNILNSRKRYTAEQIKNQLLKNSTSLYDFWEERILEIENKGTQDSYRNTLSVFRAFRKEILFEDIDYNLLNSFKQFKKGTCSNNGINSYLKNIKAVYNEGIRRGLYKPDTFISPFSQVMERAEKTRDKYFTIEELRKIVSKKEKTKYDYYFLLSFYLGGLDFIDIASLKKEHIVGGRIKFERFKGGTNEIIDNFIFPEAYEIINYFNDGEYLTDIYKYSDVKTTRGNFNKRYRKQLEHIGINSYFSSKTARYSFINVGKELLLNRDVIMELTGHSRGDVHSIYEGKYSNKIKDEVHRKIIDAVVL